MRKVVGRLPHDLRKKWITQAGNIRDKGKEPQFKELTEFVERNARYLNDPVFGTMLDNDRFSKGTFHKPSQHGIIKMTNTELSKHAGEYARNNNKSNPLISAQNKTNQNKILKCYFCQGTHSIDMCEKFEDYDLNQRMIFAKREGLCFNCLRKKHTSKSCFLMKQCKEATCTDQRKHHSLFHDSRQATSTITLRLERD